MMVRNILITGVSQGVGLEVSRAVVEAGWRVYGVSRTVSSEYRALQTKFPDQVFHQAYDLRDVAGIHRALFENFVPFSVPLHGVVNNAAVAYDDLITNLAQERLEQMYAVNVFAPMVITKYALRNMLFNRVGGSLVHLSSISAHTGYKGLAMYASTKGALEAFSKNTAREWGERKIRSNTIVAGFMETAMSSTLDDEQRGRIYKRTSLKQATSPSSVAATAVFLLGEGASSITGQDIHVDSGTI